MTAAARTPAVLAPAVLPQFKERALALRLMGLLAHWDALQGDPASISWAGELLAWEEAERARRSLEQRLRSAHIGRFKPLADFDWDWPTLCDRAAVQELMTLSFMLDATNVVLVGPNGVGKSMLACNLGHQTLIEGKTVLFTTAGQLLGDFAALDSDSLLRRRIRHYAAPDLLLIDEVGYLSYSNRHADLLFELISRRYEHKSTVITTNRKCGAPHLRFNAAKIVMQTPLPESLTLALFGTTFAPHKGGWCQRGNQFVAGAEAPRSEVRSGVGVEGLELDGRVSAGVYLARLHVGMSEPQRHLSKIFGRLQDGQGTAMPQDVRRHAFLNKLPHPKGGGIRRFASQLPEVANSEERRKRRGMYPQ